jgi:protein O-mannosyl-transferase
MTRLDSPATTRLLPLLVAAAACAIYLNALANGFAFDDVYIIAQNTRVRDLSAWRDIWLTPYWPFFGQELGIYRPFIIFLYAVQWSIGDGSALVFHAGNILLHAVVSVLVFDLLRRLTATVPALIGALVFAVHPVHTEAVANIVGQAELVAALVILGGCLVHISRPAGVAVSWPRRLVLVALFAVGLLTKESAVVLPGLLVALDFAQRRVRLDGRGLAAYASAMAMPVILMACTLAAYLILRFDVMSGAVIGVDAAPGMPYLRGEHRVLNALRAFPEFMRLLFLPIDLAADYSPGVILPVESLTRMALLGAVLLLALSALALATPWLPACGLPAAWFLISISPVSNLFFPIGVLVAERTLYVPSFALSAALAYAWLAAAPLVSPAMRRLAPAALVIVLVLAGYRSWVRNPDWMSTNTVWLSIVRDHPEAYRAQWVQGAYFAQTGRLREATAHFDLAHRIYADDSQFLVEYAAFLFTLQRNAEAVAMLERAWEMHPYIPRTVTMLAYGRLLVGRYADALPMIAHAERFGAAPTTSMPARAYAYHGLGDHDRAIGAWRAALNHADSTAWAPWAFFARALAIGGYDDQAGVALHQAGTIAPDSAARPLLDSLRSAIGSGCYLAVHPDGTGDGGFDPFRMPPCDPLGDYFRFTGQTQIAVLLQNANKVSDPQVGEESMPER